jgi:ABC-2 type transport system permease protein
MLLDSNIATTISNYINAILQNYMQEVNRTDQAAYQIQTQTQLYLQLGTKERFYVRSGVMTVILMLVSAMR